MDVYPFLYKTFYLRGNSTSEWGHLTFMVKKWEFLRVAFYLSPYLVKINSITRCIRNGVDKSLFVDDFGVSYQSKHVHAIERQLQLHLNRIEDWADNNGFKFSQSKAVCVHFCRRRGLHPDPYLVLYDNPIPVKKETKFLGILLNSKLTFVPHIKGLKKKCVKALNLLRVVSNTDWGGDRTVLLRLYRALVRSKLDYGCFIYGTACKSYISLLDPIQNQGLRRMSSLFASEEKSLLSNLQLK